MIAGTKNQWMCRTAVVSLILLLSSSWCYADDNPAVRSADTLPDESVKLWQALIRQADALALPTEFLKTIKPGFVTIEFDDLHAFAAEYHPDEHRMVLNLTLSFNMAGGTLKPLRSLPSRDLGTLYHELFHAYMDYISTLSNEGDSPAFRLLEFAKALQECRYRHVTITPIRQRTSHTEARVLTDRESWEALNETWAMFIGWAIWAQLEARGTSRDKHKKTNRAAEKGWLERLKKADHDADLTGYYEPEDPGERDIARKRYLAPAYRISSREAGALLEHVLEYPKNRALRSADVMEQVGRSSVENSSCHRPPSK